MKKTFCYNLSLGVFAVSVSMKTCTVQATEPEKSITPLDAEFLLYIAQMEKLDQQWLDPITVNEFADNREKALKNTVNDNMKTPAAPSHTPETINEKGAQ